MFLDQKVFGKQILLDQKNLGNPNLVFVLRTFFVCHNWLRIGCVLGDIIKVWYSMYQTFGGEVGRGGSEIKSRDNVMIVNENTDQ